MDGDLRISDLRSFTATARAGSITRGAVALGLTQPTVTQRIHRLEHAAGERILIREPRGVRVTPAGEKLLNYAERILALHDDARASVQGDSGSPKGHRAVGLLEDLAITTLPTALADFAALHPLVDLEVVIGSARVLRGLADRGRLDLVFGDPSAVAEASIRWRYQAVLSWACAPSFDPAAEPLPLVLFSHPCQWRQPVLDAITRHGRQWRIAFQSTSVHAVQAAISAGIGVGALLATNIPANALRPSGPHNLPEPPKVEVVMSRRAGTDTDVAIDSLERLLRRALTDTSTDAVPGPR